MIQLRAAVFDLDGTLIDSVPDIAAALNVSLSRDGRASIPEEDVMHLVGGGARELIRRALGAAATPAEVDRMLAKFLSAYEAEPVARTHLYPGAREMLERLHGVGVPLAICTNKPIGLARVILDALGLAHYFAMIWGSETGQPLKPDAACLRAVCVGLGVAPQEAAMIGDGGADVEAARAVGCPSILVRQGYEVRPAESLGADAVADDLPGALAILDRWLREGISSLRPPA